MTAKIADALEISLDYLVGSTYFILEKNMLKRLADIQKLPTEQKTHVFGLLDAFLRDYSTKQAYA